MSSLPLSHLVDTHCHLYLADFESDRYLVIHRARNAGVNRLLVPGIDIDTSRSAIGCTKQYHDAYSAVGIHPNSANTWTTSSVSELRQLAHAPKVVAIGEIGLDYYRNRASRQLQRRIFQEQLELSAEVGLPVIIHNRDASEDVLGILVEWHQALRKNGSDLANHPGVLHSFSGDIRLAEKVNEVNFKIGITGPVTFQKAQEIQSVVIALPMDSLLIETDAPYLTPHPYRGKRNEPANVRIVVEKIAELKQAPVEVVADTTTETADQLFDWRSIH
ncbi:MAG TPA: TatD family hydrolase [Anaerolineales bacterium]|nr:TatD family hydrolase [Anaerolineales bacterium]